MKNYWEYGVEDYLADPSFREWVRDGGFRNPAAEWSRRLNTKQDRLKIAMRAREILLAAALKEEAFPEGYFEKIRDQTLSEVRRQRNEGADMPRRLFPWSIAASVVLLLAAALWLLIPSKRSTEAVVAETAAVPSVREIYKSNESERVLPVALPDGSSVLLQPHSSISYSEVFNEARREVRLSGQAFFEVMKDPARPFYVYSGEMVTKVLGTSFTVSAFEEASSFSVVVKTGKVSVFAQKGKQAGEESPAAAIDLTPFQQAVFDREELSFTRSQIRPSGLAVLAPSAINFYEFDDTPAPEVFRRLGKAYGVLIELDEQLLSDCALTTTLSDEPLFEKMAILCQAIGPGTSFVLEDDRIRIRSKGCNQ